MRQTSTSRTRTFMRRPTERRKQDTHGSTTKADRRHRPNRRRRSELVAGFSSTAVPVGESSAANGKIVCPLFLPAPAAGVGKLAASSFGGRVDQPHKMEYTPVHDASESIRSYQTAGGAQ